MRLPKSASSCLVKTAWLSSQETARHRVLPYMPFLLACLHLDSSVPASAPGPLEHPVRAVGSQLVSLWSVLVPFLNLILPALITSLSSFKSFSGS